MQITYKPGEWSKVRIDFEKAFGVSFGKFYSGTLTVVYNEVKIDLWVFFDFLVSKGMQDNESMEDFVIRRYGIFALETLKKLL